jgi:hypothetical protein
MAPTTGSNVRRQRYSAPPGITASSTSSAIKPTKKAIPMSLTEKRNVCANRK